MTPTTPAPTVKHLQASAVELVKRMAEVKP